MNKATNKSDLNPVVKSHGKSILQVLIIDDEKSFTEELHEFLEKSGYTCTEAHTGEEGLHILKSNSIDLLILDVLLPGMNGLDILKQVRVQYPGMEVIMVSGHGDMDTVIQAMRLGALDYLRKPFRLIDIRLAIERTRKFLLLQQKIRQMEEKNSLISKSLEERANRGFIGISDAIREVIEMATLAAKHPDTHVLITGESGTGKENVARIIHYLSSRKDHLFVAVNSSAITESLLESEFFGHKKGSFTGALMDRKGFLEISDGGTLFLDEIADMPMNLQAMLLRVIEEKTFVRVGDTQPVSSDFRIISATNHDLDKLVNEKKFRLDLFHRLNTFHITIPPLRSRQEDIEPLLHYFVESYAVKLNKPVPAVSKEALTAMKKYHFPGNVRELKNMTERAMIISKDNILRMSDFPFGIQDVPHAIPAIQSLNLAQTEKELLLTALKNNGFNQIAASRSLGISRDALIRKMKKYNISVIRKDL